MASNVLYPIGSEPTEIAERIDKLTAKLNAAYPGKDITGFRAQHKKWGEAAATLAKALGYENGDAFLEAYGYTSTHNLGGRPSNDHTAIIDELRRRYPDGAPVHNVSALSKDNPDLAGRLKTLVNSAQKLFGMPLAAYLAQEGILPAASASATEMRDPADAKADKKKQQEEVLRNGALQVLESLRAQYSGKPAAMSFVLFKKEHPEIAWRVMKQYAEKYTPDKSLEKLLISEGILRETMSQEELCDYLVGELKKRLNGQPFCGKYSELKNAYPDLPFSDVSSNFPAATFFTNNGLLTPKVQNTAPVRASGGHHLGATAPTSKKQPLQSVKILKWYINNGEFMKANWVQPQNATLFEAYETSTEIVLPEGITKICENAFRDCANLKSIVLPKGITKIDSFAFCGCSSLTTIVLPEGITEIASCTFYNCSNLTSIVIPESVTSIGWSAFEGCTSLTNIVIPKRVTTISGGLNGLRSCGAFQGCTSLTNVVIPERVTDISGAFEGCTSLTSIVIPKRVRNISGAFKGCTNLTSIIIPESVTNISGAFEGCTSLTSVVLPAGLAAIGKDAFGGCSNITDIVISENVTSIEANAFDHSVLKKHLSPSHPHFIYEGHALIARDGTLLWGEKHVSKAVIPSWVTQIKDYAFYNCDQLTEVTIPEGVTRIGNNAFACSSLQKVLWYPANCTVEKDSIGKNALDVRLYGKLPALNPFPSGTVFHDESNVFKTSDKLPSYTTEFLTDTDAETCAYIMLYQSGKQWEQWIRKYCTLADAVLKSAVQIAAKVEPLTDTTVKRMTEFLNDHLPKIETGTANTLMDLLKAKAPKFAKALAKNSSVSKLLKGQLTIHPIETVVSERLKTIVLSSEAAKGAEKGLPYADNSGVSTPEAVALLLHEYASEWNRLKTEISGGMSMIQVLADGSKVMVSALADQIAAALDHQALMTLLDGLIHTAGYRPYLLAYARFANEQECLTFVSEIRRKKAGTPKIATGRTMPNRPCISVIPRLL